jgi:hypothetical protein
MRKVHLLFLFFWVCKFLAQNPEDSSFMPESGKYVLSAWVKQSNQTQLLTYLESSIKLSINDGNNPSLYSIILKPSGNIIDGWQRIESAFEIPVFATNILNPILSIELICESSQSECYFDDIRVYPADGNMKSFVYDPDTKKLMAELDENNYATFYEYDAEGGLVRVKKETEKGVFTIQETRSSTTKK